MPGTIIVVPCFDEAERLDAAAFADFVRRTPGVDFLFVDDGSRDGTLGRLEELASRQPDRLGVLGLPANRGKAEAVRTGVLAACDRTPRFVGYWDADLATPLEEIPRFVAALEERPERQAVYGSRVKLLGRSIERKASRHYLGRVYATAVSLALDLPVYDTQCGAKLFRVNSEVRRLFEQPFSVGWSFDVEIIARLIAARRGTSLPGAEVAICEIPLMSWRDVPGSKVVPTDFVVGLLEVLRIYRRYRHRG